MELGGNIELIGFSDRDGSDLIVIKKIVGNFAKDISDSAHGLNALVISLQEVHRDADSRSVTIHGLLRTSKKEYETQKEDSNLYFALNAVLRELDAQLSA